MRCPDCNKFVGLEMSDPEAESIELNGSTISGTVRIVRCCADCGGELKEATLDVEIELDSKIIEAHTGDGHELELEADDPTSTEEGGGRYKKSYFGAEFEYRVTCSCQKRDKKDPKKEIAPLIEGNWSDQIQASAMDEMV